MNSYCTRDGRKKVFQIFTGCCLKRSRNFIIGFFVDNIVRLPRGLRSLLGKMVEEKGEVFCVSRGLLREFEGKRLVMKQSRKFYEHIILGMFFDKYYWVWIFFFWKNKFILCEKIFRKLKKNF